MRLNLGGWYVPDKLREGEPDPIESQWQEGLDQLEAALPHITRRDVGIQAGGRCGLWPTMLSGVFRKVVTLEPDPINFECLQANLSGKYPNVVAFDAALGSRKRYAYLKPSPHSTGEAHIATPPISGAMPRVQMISIDELMLEEGGQVGAIFLDVEGYELDVLIGARSTLIADRPTLILEENTCCHRYGGQRGGLARWLKPLGYELAGSFAKLPPDVQNDGHFRGADLIFAPV